MSLSVLEPIIQVARQPLPQQCLEAAIIGVLAHLLYFIHWVKDTNSFNVFLGHFNVVSTITFIEFLARGHSGGLFAGFVVFLSYLDGLFASMLIYRAFFHPLRHIPGPFMAKLTKFFGIYLTRNARTHEEYDDLIQEYGEFVRIGPNQILHNSLDCMKVIHGPQAKCIKANWYSTMEYGPHRILNLDAITDKTEHRFRRQVWDKAFNGQALDAREEPIRDTILEWLSQVDRHDGRPLNFTLFASLMTFDITGKAGFSTDFGGVKSGKENIMQTYIQALFKSMTKMGHIPWALNVFKRSKLPLNKNVFEFERLARDLVDKRLQDTEPKEDIIQHMIEDYRSEKPKAFFTKYHLETDAQAILIGAADSSFSPMSFGLWHLVTDPKAMGKLRAELAPLFNTTQTDGFAHVDLAHAEYLNSVIDETLRLYSPALVNGPKETPPEGIVMSDTFIPGHVSVISSIWSFHRSEKYFVKPTEWLPERFTTQPELVLDKRAFHPFSYGPFNCVGQRMALMTLRMALAYTVWFCDIELAPGYDRTSVVTQASNQLFFVPGPLHLVFKKRDLTQV